MPARICVLFFLLVLTGTAVRLRKTIRLMKTERIGQTPYSTADTLDGPAAEPYQATRRERHAKSDKAVQTPPVAKPAEAVPYEAPPLTIQIRDPRTNEWDLTMRAFYFPGRMLQWDKLCGAAFCGNFYEIEDGMMFQGYKFKNAEAAYQCLKYFTHPRALELIPKFEQATGTQAFRLKEELKHEMDRTYGGHGSAWMSMQAVLEAKFSTPHMKNMLLATGDDFLLEHNSVRGRDRIWSDNEDGEGTNWLGLQLMVLRDKLRGISRGHVGSWSNYIYERIQELDGAVIPWDPRTPWKLPWINTVKAARQKLVFELNQLNNLNLRPKK